MKTTSVEARPFRAIIVGGGLLGLTAAHIFAKTNMDFVVLEQHDDLMPEIGSLLLLLPSTFRVLDQLGILDAVEAVMMRMDRDILMSAADGTIWAENHPLPRVQANHGHGIRITHRPHYVKALYNSLPEAARTRIHVRKRVVRIETNDDGAAVHCADGSVERGDVVIGADGVHSRARQAMQALAAGLPADVPQPSPYTTTYRELFGNLPALPDLPAGANFEGAAAGVSTQVLTAEGRAWFALYERLDNPTNERRRWTEDDKAAMLTRWGHLYVAPGYTVRRVCECAEGPLGLISLEEGVAETWWWRRIVLVGDAVHKVTPHAGLGYNTGVMDLVELANRLRRLTVEHEGAAAPLTTADFEAQFAAYQAERMRDTPTVLDMSERRARMSAWLTSWDWFTARVLIPWLPLAAFSLQYILGPLIARSPVLDWLDEKQLPPGAMAYVHHPNTGTEEKPEKPEKPAPPKHALAAPVISRLPLLAGTLALATLGTMGLGTFGTMMQTWGAWIKL